MKEVSVLITDLDNTLYDWVDMWAQGFRAFIASLAAISGIPEDRLKPAIRKIHQRHGTSEYAFVVEELGLLKDIVGERDVREVFQVAIDARRHAYQTSMRLYPGVMETLVELRARGTLIVGYSESLEYYAADRIRRLELDGVLDIVYTQEDHGIPDSVVLNNVRSHPPGHYTLSATQHRHTPTGELKPNPHILQSIVTEVGADLRSVAYVGDSLMKDVAMAQSAGVADVWAKYGTVQHKPDYELLREVSHWPDAEVEQEKVVIREPLVTPTFVLQNRFAELRELFRFEPLMQNKAQR